MMCYFYHERAPTRKKCHVHHYDRERREDMRPVKRPESKAKSSLVLLSQLMLQTHPQQWRPKN